MLETLSQKALPNMPRAGKAFPVVQVSPEHRLACPKTKTNQSRAPGTCVCSDAYVSNRTRCHLRVAKEKGVTDQRPVQPMEFNIRSRVTDQPLHSGLRNMSLVLDGCITDLKTVAKIKTTEKEHMCITEKECRQASSKSWWNSILTSLKAFIHNWEKGFVHPSIEVSTTQKEGFGLPHSSLRLLTTRLLLTQSSSSHYRYF